MLIFRMNHCPIHFDSCSELFLSRNKSIFTHMYGRVLCLTLMVPLLQDNRLFFYRMGQWFKVIFVLLFQVTKVLKQIHLLAFWCFCMWFDVSGYLEKQRHKGTLMFIYLVVRVCVCLCVCVWMCVCVDACVHACMCVCMHAHVFVCCVFLCLCVYVTIYVCVLLSHVQTYSVST